MPSRIIKEGIKRSAQIDELSWFEEVVFYRLIVTADDYGCVDGRIVLLKNELFPLKENVTKKSVEDAVSHLVSAGLLHKYEVNGMPYLFFPSWEKHQRVRNKMRKFPAPPECNVAVTCPTFDRQTPAECPIESESNTNTNPLSNPIENSNPNDSLQETSRTCAHEEADVIASFHSLLERDFRKLSLADRENQKNLYQRMMEVITKYAAKRKAEGSPISEDDIKNIYTLTQSIGLEGLISSLSIGLFEDA